MNKIFTPSLLLLGLFIAGCGKNDNTNTTTPVVPPVVTNPINTNPGVTPININQLRNLFATQPLNSNVRVGDYFDKVEVSGWFNISFSFILFGQRFGENNAPTRYAVSNVTANVIDVSEDGQTAEPIDRVYLQNLIFSDDQTDIYTVARRGCVHYDDGSGRVKVLQAAIIDKFWNSGFGGGFGQQGQLVESVVITTQLPLYMNPISVQSTINPTRYVRRYKQGAAVINIVGAGPCQ
jgi:hypothetical protein